MTHPPKKKKPTGLSRAWIQAKGGERGKKKKKNKTVRPTRLSTKIEKKKKGGLLGVKGGNTSRVWGLKETKVGGKKKRMQSKNGMGPHIEGGVEKPLASKKGKKAKEIGRRCQTT